MNRSVFLLAVLGLGLQGCLAVGAARMTGDVVEGAAKTTAFTVKTTGRAVGTVTPGGSKNDKDAD